MYIYIIFIHHSQYIHCLMINDPWRPDVLRPPRVRGQKETPPRRAAEFMQIWPWFQQPSCGTEDVSTTTICLREMNELVHLGISEDFRNKQKFGYTCFRIEHDNMGLSLGIVYQTGVYSMDCFWYWLYHVHRVMGIRYFPHGMQL